MTEIIQAVLFGDLRRHTQIADCLQIHRVGGIIFEFAAELQNKRSKVLPLFAVLDSPNRTQEFGVRPKAKWRRARASRHWAVW